MCPQGERLAKQIKSQVIFFFFASAENPLCRRVREAKTQLCLALETATKLNNDVTNCENNAITISNTLNTLLFFTDFCLSYLLIVIINNFTQQTFIINLQRPNGSQTIMMSGISNEQLTEGPRECSESAVSMNINKKVIMTKM